MHIILARGAEFFMQIITVFNLTPKEYIKHFNSLMINRPEKCQKCGVYHSFHSHGCYWRNLLDDTCEERIPVVRFCCKICNQTVSILPAFALPYFLHTWIWYTYMQNILLKGLNLKAFNMTYFYLIGVIHQKICFLESKQLKYLMRVKVNKFHPPLLRPAFGRLPPLGTPTPGA